MAKRRKHIQATKKIASETSFTTSSSSDEVLPQTSTPFRAHTRLPDFPSDVDESEEQVSQPTSRQQGSPQPGGSRQKDSPQPGPSRQRDSPQPGPSRQRNSPQPGPSRQRDSPQPGPSRQRDSPSQSDSARQHNEQAGRRTRNKSRLPKSIKEIIKLQNSTNLLLRKLPFARLVREIMLLLSCGNYRIKVDALGLLQESAEYYIIEVLQDAYLCSFHAKRVTLMSKDIQLARRIRMRFES